MTLRKKLVKYFFVFQLLLFFPGCILIVISFFDGEDSLQESFVRAEVKHFVESYRENANATLPQGHTFSTYVGTQNMPERYVGVVKDLALGIFELKLEGTPGFSEEEEIRVMVEEINAGEPYFYFISYVNDEQGEGDLFRNLFVSVSVYFLFVGVVGFLLSYFFSKKISQPLESIAKKIDALKESEPTTDFDVGDYDTEIGELVSAIDRKNKRIADFIFRERNVMKNISHELRTPITVLKSSLSLAVLNKPEDESYLVDSKIIEKMERASKDLESMVEAFLWLGREDNDNIDYKTHCASCIEKAIADHRYLLKGKPVEVSVMLEPNVTINCKEAIFYIVVSNLVRNAFNFTHEGVIAITLMSNIFSVSDSGIGVDEAIVGKIKNSGIKGEKSTGFGLGLDIVERICEHMGWCLNIEGNHASHGTLALVSFS